MTNQNVQTNRHGSQNRGCNQVSADGEQASPTMSIGLNEGNVGRSVYPGFGKSSYEGGFIMSLSEENQSEVIEAVSSTSRYLDD